MEFEMTIKEWLESIDDKEVRDRALKNSYKYGVNEVKEPNLSEAILGAFRWDETPEGAEYWQNIHEDFECKNK